MKKDNRKPHTGDRAADKLIVRLQEQEDAALGERRRRLANGMARALLHLTNVEMSVIEEVVYCAVGRSVVERLSRNCQ